ncbi:MAG: Y-family DNA polymerase [Bacteroidales bacterium]|nr:Y-family DNA polymerase [Bacteroidales bacterium]
MYYLHIDCNSYFASCEVATRPELVGRPVVVANENEHGGGVILALNAEAKNVGLKRGIPLFKVRDTLKTNDVAICKVDHKKYRRISNKIMDEVVAQGIVLDFVQYSIDEFFGTLPVDNPDIIRRCVHEIKQLISDSTGIPTGCGCSQTYTLAKCATWFAKHYDGYDGVCVLPPDKRERALSLLAISDVWGIGRQTRRKLEQMGVATALDFTHLPQNRVEQTFNTATLHTYLELCGTPTIQLESHSRRKSIMQSHTFAVMIENRDELSSEVARFAARCAESLRKQGSVCRSVTVFVNTNRYRDDLAQYHNDATAKLNPPTADSPTLIRTAERLIAQLYRPGYQYKRAGVVLTGISDDAGQQLDLFTSENEERRRRLMDVTDKLNRRFGDETVTFG